MLLAPSIQNVFYVRHQYGAGWTAAGARRTGDMADFGPKVEAPDPLADPPVAVGVPKPVKYLPVPRRGGKESFPAISLGIGLSEPGRMRALKVPAWEGAEVRIRVLNLWDPAQPQWVDYKGTLRGLACKLVLTPDDVKRWFGVDGPLHALVNENLLDFQFRIPAIEEDGKVFAGESHNRLFLYRRKAVVFFPGVFGSQVQFKTPDGQVLGFPDFFVDDRPASGPYAAQESIGKLGSQLGSMTSPVQKLGALECDAAGKPLMEPSAPTLLTVNIPCVGPQAYDVFDCLHQATRRRFAQLPESFRLFTLFAAPYDWRGDLTQTALQKLEGLRVQRDQSHHVGHADDTDDQVAVIGHSTGGLVVRRMLVESAAEQLISHAFFMNVPFRGAPKTFAVMATGCDPLGKDAMMPIVHPKSMRAMALTAPVVYHLSASRHYSSEVDIFYTHGGTSLDRQPDGLDAERMFVQLAIETGFMPSRKVIPAGASLPPAARQNLVARADDWNQYWEDLTRHRRANQLNRWVYPAFKDPWEKKELARRGLADQDALRIEQGWSDTLAAAATSFHDTCERWALEGKWADRCYISYSVSRKRTTVSTSALLDHAEECQLDQLLDAIHTPMRLVIEQQEIAPPIREDTPNPYAIGEHQLREAGAWLVEQWYPAANGRFRREIWRFASLQQCAAGDETVPLCSQIGFGGPARVFKRLVDPDGAGPDHMAATKRPEVWDRIVKVLQGADLHEDLENPAEVNPINGISIAQDLLALQKRYAGV